MTRRSPPPSSERVGPAATPCRSEVQSSGPAERDDRHQGVPARSAADGVAVPGHTVAAVPVEAEPGRDQLGTGSAQVVGGEGGSRPVQHRVGSDSAGTVGGHEAGHRDPAVVHHPFAPTARAPRRPVPRRGGPTAPPSRGGGRSRRPRRAGSSECTIQRTEVGLGAGIEERALEDGHRRPSLANIRSSGSGRPGRSVEGRPGRCPEVPRAGGGPARP